MFFSLQKNITFQKLDFLDRERKNPEFDEIIGDLLTSNFKI